MEWVDIVTKLVVAIVVTVTPIVWALIKRKLKLNEENWKGVVRIIEQSVEDVYINVVRDLKKASADGKLTKEEIKDLQEKAWVIAEKVGSDKGIDLIKEFAKVGGKEYFPVLVSKVISEVRGKRK